jgi:hypothetical protein
VPLAAQPAAGYWAGDVAGERGDGRAGDRGDQCTGHSRLPRLLYRECGVVVADGWGRVFGADGIKRFLADIEDIGPDFRIEVQRVQAIGDSNAIAFLRIGATGRASGIVTGAESANVYDFIDGKISRVRIFLDRDEALKAVGLAE